MTTSLGESQRHAPAASTPKREWRQENSMDQKLKEIIRGAIQVGEG